MSCSDAKTVNKIFVQKVVNQGKIQDDYECKSSNAVDEITLSIQSGGMSATVFEQKLFGKSTSQKVDKNYLCVDYAQFTLKEVDTFVDNSDSGIQIDCSKTGYFYTTMRVEATNCLFQTTNIEYRVYYYVRKWDESMHA